MSRRYNTNEDALHLQVADMARRLARLEIAGTLSTPNNPWQWVTETDYTTPPISVTSGAFVTIYRLYPNTHKPGLSVYTRYSTGAATQLELQLVYTPTSDVIGGPFQTLANTTGFFGIRGRSVNVQALTDEVQLQARRIGAGTARIVILSASGGDVSAESF